MKLAQRIRRLRFKAGSLDLDFPETKIRLDERGTFCGIEKTVNDVVAQLIEEYMLLSERGGGGRLMSQHTPAVIASTKSRRTAFAGVSRGMLSQNVPCGNLRQTAEVQKLLHRLGTLPSVPRSRSILKSTHARALRGRTARHYGLAKAKYTHFTSPSARYAEPRRASGALREKPRPMSALKETAEHISSPNAIPPTPSATART